MNKNYSHYLIVLLLLSTPFIYLFTFYNSLPDTIPTHFNIKGEADGFGSKSMAFFGPVFIGIVSLFTYMVMINLKKLILKGMKTTMMNILKYLDSSLLPLCLH